MVTTNGLVSFTFAATEMHFNLSTYHKYIQWVCDIFCHAK